MSVMNVCCPVCGQVHEKEYLVRVATQRNVNFTDVWLEFTKHGCSAVDTRHSAVYYDRLMQRADTAARARTADNES
jgi:hypothetical protein